MRVSIGLSESPAPVRAGRRQQLEGLDRLRGLQVRAAAQVLEPVLRVEADLAVRQVAGQLQLVRLRLRLEAGQDLGLVHAVGAHERVLLGEDPAHLLLDPLQVVRRDRLGELEVVVEAVGDRRADRHLGVGPQVQHRLGHHVRRRVAQHGQRLRIASRQDAHAVALGQRQPQVAHLVADVHGDGGLGQPRADRGGRIQAGGAVLQLQIGPVGQFNAHGREHIDRRC